MAKPYTTAIFEANGEFYQGCATYDRECDDPWHVFIVKDNDYFRFVGRFKRLEGGWEATKHILGISGTVDLPRTEGEGMDGGPFSSNDATHVR